MSGWCPSSSVCGMAVVCTAAVLPSAVVWSVPYSSHCSAGEYCCHVVYCSSPGVWCVGGVCVSVVFVWWGILCPLPPRRGGGWGHRGWWGGIVDGGVAVLPASPSCVWCPPSVCVVVLLNGGVCGVWCPRARIGSSPSHCSRPLLYCLFSLLALSIVCVCCHSIVGCGVSLWQGCVIVE